MRRELSGSISGAMTRDTVALITWFPNNSEQQNQMDRPALAGRLPIHTGRSGDQDWTQHFPAGREINHDVSYSDFSGILYVVTFDTGWSLQGYTVFIY